MRKHGWRCARAASQSGCRTVGRYPNLIRDLRTHMCTLRDTHVHGLVYMR